MTRSGCPASRLRRCATTAGARTPSTGLTGCSSNRSMGGGQDTKLSTVPTGWRLIRALRQVVDGRAVDAQAASASQMGRFETETLAMPENRATLSDLNGQWIDRFHDRNGFKYIVLDMDCSVSPTHGAQESAAWNGHFDCSCQAPFNRRRNRPDGADAPCASIGSVMTAFPAGTTVMIAVMIAGWVTDMRRGMNTLALGGQQGLGRDPDGGEIHLACEPGWDGRADIRGAWRDPCHRPSPGPEPNARRGQEGLRPVRL